MLFVVVAQTVVSSQSDGVMASKTLRYDRECFHEMGEYKRLPRRGRPLTARGSLWQPRLRTLLRI